MTRLETRCTGRRTPTKRSQYGPGTLSLSVIVPFSSSSNEREVSRKCSATFAVLSPRKCETRTRVLLMSGLLLKELTPFLLFSCHVVKPKMLHYPVHLRDVQAARCDVCAKKDSRIGGTKLVVPGPIREREGESERESERGVAVSTLSCWGTSNSLQTASCDHVCSLQEGRCSSAARHGT